MKLLIKHLKKLKPFNLKCVLSDDNSHAYSCLATDFMKYLFYSFIFNLFVFLYVKWSPIPVTQDAEADNIVESQQSKANLSSIAKLNIKKIKLMSIRQCLLVELWFLFKTNCTNLSLLIEEFNPFTLISFNFNFNFNFVFSSKIFF